MTTNESLEPLDPRLREAVAALPDEIEPARDLWAAVHAGIDAERVQELGVAVPRRRVISVRVAAAAAVVLMAVTAGATWLLGPRTNVVINTGTGAALSNPDLGFVAYERSVSDLAALYERRAASLDPATREVLERSIKTIDEALEDARLALHRDPANAEVRAFVESAYQQKLDFLRRANDVASLREM